ncbi:unnamed protein product, partial [Closterium sp. NIES-53]
MEVARTSMIHAAAPHFLWPFAVRSAAHQLNLWPRVSLSETSPTLRWTGEVGDASVFRVKGSRAFVRDTSADKLSARAIPCVFLGFPLDAPGWQFYHPTSRRVFPSQEVTFDELVPFYRIFPYRSAPPPPPPLFLAPDPLSRTMPVEAAVGSGATSGGAASGGAETRGAESKGGGSRGAEVGGLGVWSLGVLSPAGGSPRLSPWSEPLSSQQLREWFAKRTRLWSGAAGAGVSAVGDTGVGGVGVTAGAGGARGAAAAGPGGTKDTGGAGTGSVGGAGAGGAGAGDPALPGGAGAGGAGAGDTGTVDPKAGGAGAGGVMSGGTGDGGTM